MMDSITTEELHQDDGQPATKRDLRLLKATINASLTMRFAELRDHFDVAVENIKEEMRGANADEISLLKDKKDDHEERLTVVEQKMGLR